MLKGSERVRTQILGVLNQRTSLPEFIESVGPMPALWILGRYCRGKFSEDKPELERDFTTKHTKGTKNEFLMVL